MSAASTWEIAIKSALGKLDAELEAIVAECEAIGFTDLPVRFAHTARVTTLPWHHRDPFDRLLIAQALEEGLTLVTKDDAFEAHVAITLWR